MQNFILHLSSTANSHVLRIQIIHRLLYECTYVDVYATTTILTSLHCSYLVWLLLLQPSLLSLLKSKNINN